MSSTAFYTVVLLACALKFSASQTSCKGRCGSEYYRGYMCQCDYNCLSYGECCRDFESQCTTKNSCLGRCGEAFKRGRLCSCDPDCVKYQQCCPDFKQQCDAEEKNSGSSSATAPVKTNSCDNVNNNKPKEPTLNDATEQPSTFNEGNEGDDYVVPPDGPTDELGDDINSKIYPVDDFSNNGVEELEASPIPETSSGYEPTTEPTMATDTTEATTEATTEVTTEVTTEPVTVFPQTETPTDDADLFTVDSTTGEAPTESTDAGDFISSTDVTAPPQPTTAADDDSTQPTATSELQTEPSTIFPEAETEEPTETPSPDAVFTSEAPETTAVPFSTTSDPSTPDSTAAPEETTSDPNTESDSGDVTTSPDDSTSVPPEGSELDAVTTELPSSTAAAQDDTTDNVPLETTTADPLKVTPKPTDPTTSEPQDKPDPNKPQPAKPETKPLDVEQTSNIHDTRGFQGDDSNDTNLCSGRPVGAVTTLRNGTVVVFRGHYFWFLDRNRVPGPARGITQVWGVPSPVDTVLTRCNCQGKTYIFKGNQYWRFENDALDSGYPKAVSVGFDGLRGHITAALSVPQHQTRRESVYFFKRGGYVQKYSYQFGTSPTCSRKPQYTIYTVRNRVARQAVSVLGPSINIRTTWRGFPSTVTAAVSVPNNREPEGYKYYVFSRTKSYSVRMNGERPVIATPKANAPPQSNDVFKCPKKV